MSADCIYVHFIVQARSDLIEDPVLEQGIREALDITEGELTLEDLGNLTSLWKGRCNGPDASGKEEAGE